MQKTIPFSDFDINSTLLKTIEEMGFETPTPIQEQTIEPILSGKDIFAQAETGSGKTAAFSIPILEKICRDDLAKRDKFQDVLYVVLSPTRELAQQTNNVFKIQGKPLGIDSVCLIGGESIERQKELIRKKPHIVVATPGRICDLLNQRVLSIKHCKGVVFDEADRLFDMGFKKDIEYILKLTPKDRQLIMVSATINNDVLNTAYRFHSHPIELKVNEDGLLVDKIDHKIAMLSANEKMPLLVNIIRNHESAYALVFCNTQYQTHLVAEWLIKMGLKAKPISGRLPQNKRTSLMKEFRSREITILVCTDVAARGLDIEDVNLVINYDMPQYDVNYVHRIGRTGRAGKEGEAISFCAPEDCEHLDGIYKLIDSKIPKMKLENSDFATDLCKRPYIDSKTLRVVDRYNKGPQKSSFNKKIEPRKLKPVKKSKQFKLVSTKKVESFEIESYSIEEAKQSALKYFKVKRENELILLKKEELRKRFIVFGKKLTKYKYNISPTYKDVVMPFLINVIGLSDLKLYAKYTGSGKNINVFFNGVDEKMLTYNNNELLLSLEYLTRLHLYNSMKVNRDARIAFSCTGFKNESDSDSLLSMIDKMVKKVVDSGKPITLRPLNPRDRRLVHKHLDSQGNVKSVSKGEGKMKRIEIVLT